jgi:hypothetical protein
VAPRTYVCATPTGAATQAAEMALNFGKSMFEVESATSLLFGLVTDIGFAAERPVSEVSDDSGQLLHKRCTTCNMITASKTGAIGFLPEIPRFFSP